jgi:hypothetical protein
LQHDVAGYKHALNPLRNTNRVAAASSEAALYALFDQLNSNTLYAHHQLLSSPAGISALQGSATALLTACRTGPVSEKLWLLLLLLLLLLLVLLLLPEQYDSPARVFPVSV